MSSVRTTIIRLAKWALGSRNALPSGALTHAGQRPTGDEPLREAGFDAKYMKGGHSAWKAIGGPIKLYT